jgi:sporulation protein YlmC with PRC-barrel domain
MLKPLAIAIAITVLAMGAGHAKKAAPGAMTATGKLVYEPARPMDTVPANLMALSNWHDKDVYDPSKNKIGEIKDLLIDKSGQVQAVILSVGGFLGFGEKDVAIPFNAVYPSQRRGKTSFTVNVSKEDLKKAPAYRYDRNQGSWTVGRMN